MEKKVVQLELETTGFDQVEQQTKSIKAQLREAQAEVVSLSEKFGETSKEAIQAAKRAAQLKDAIGEAKDLTDSFNPDGKFNALTRSIGGALDGFSAFQGSLGLIGVESEDTEKMILKVQSAMALSQGIQGVLEARDSFKKLGAVITDTFKGIKGALLASGIGAFVVLLGTVVAYWDDISEAVGLASAGQKAYTKTLEQYTAGAKEAVQTTQKVGNAFKMAKNGVISKEEALLTYNETLGDSFGKATTLAEAEKLYNDKAPEYQKAMALRAQANALFELSAQKAAEKMTLSLEDQTTFFDKSVAGLKLTFGYREEAYSYLDKKQKQRLKEGEKQLDKEINSINKVAFATMNSAETTEKANGIKSESEIKLANERKARNDEHRKQLEEDKNNALANIKELEKEYLTSLKSQQEQELQAVTEKYAQALKDAEKYKQDSTLILEAQEKEKNEITKKYLDLENQIILDAKKQARQNEVDLENEYLQKIEDLQELNTQATKTQYQNQIDAVNEKYFALEEAARGNAEQEKIIAEAKARDIAVIDEEIASKKIALENDIKVAKIQMASDAINVIADIATMFLGKSEADARKAFKINKAASIAQAIVSTYLGANAIFASAAANPKTVLFPAQPFIAAGIAITSGLANVAKIARTKFEGGGGGGGGGGNNSAPPSTAGQTVTSSAPSFQIVGNAGANPLAGLGGAPIKAYVVSAEVTTSQQLDRNHIKNATFG
jgi:hypothetical protein